MYYTVGAQGNAHACQQSRSNTQFTVVLDPPTPLKRGKNFISALKKGGLTGIENLDGTSKNV